MLFPFLFMLQAQAGAVKPAAGLVITQSTRFAPGTYRLAAPASLDSALITIQGDSVTVDLTGVTLLGTDPAADPDQAQGVAIRVEGGRAIRIVRGDIHGYRMGILAHGTRDLTIDSVDVSYSWKPRLFSLVEHESLADWLSFHHNDNGEWRRFGAGIYLDSVTGGRVRGNTGVQGMNGLMLVRSDSVEVSGNNFSFNSGLGIGLYRSSWNTIVGNRLDYNVRGFSHGFYRRGQDSADLLLYEQSAHNLVAYNSATHGGDGLFLWAGQSTMDSGTGGANDNLFYKNDFSDAPANGMEATFSRNAFLGNIANGNDYGLWGGYSFGSLVAGNCFAGNRTGIAIEHGQDNRIEGNVFTGDTTAIRLWGDAIAPSDWGYPKHRDTRSRDYTIARNVVSGARVGLRSARTSGLTVQGNQFVAVDTPFALSDTAGFAGPANASEPLSSACGPEAHDADSLVHDNRLEQLSGAIPTSAAARLDRSAIVVDDWGPYDYRSPKLWPLDSVRSPMLRMRVLGPEGAWRVATRRGVRAIAPLRGKMGDTLRVTPQSADDWAVLLEYRGGETVSPRGVATPAGRTVRFGYGRYEPRQLWIVRVFSWSDTTDPRTHVTAFDALLQSPPRVTRIDPRLDYEWYRPSLPGIPDERWALEATTAVTLPAGDYTLRAISDDAVRVWVDGTLAIDNWAPHESQVDNAALTGGRHQLKVRYYQLDGWVELRVDIVPGRVTSTGSPGPH